MDDNTTTPAEFVKLRDQLTLDLGALVGDPAQARRSAEYLLASGLVPLSTIRARYDETHPVAEGESTEPEVKTWAPGEGIEVGATVRRIADHLAGYIKAGAIGKVTAVDLGHGGDRVRVSFPGLTDPAILNAPTSLQRIS